MPFRSPSLSRTASLRVLGACLVPTIAMTAMTTLAADEPAAQAPADKPAPETLRIGDMAEDLAPEILWMRNMLVPEWKDDTVYVLYLWSPDSPNSMGSFPQLHGLDQKLRADGVVTVSVALDVADGGFEPIDIVKSRAEFMAHTVAEDRGTYIHDHWYAPSGFDHLPVVFVIDQEGTIVFMDDKLMKIDEVVHKVLADDWDIQLAAREFDRVRELETRLEPVIEKATTDAMKGNWTDVIDAADTLLSEDKEHYYKMAMTKFMLNLTKLNKPSEAYIWGYEIIEDHIKNDSAMLIAMSETINFTPNIPYRDYNLARKAAERADVLTDGKLAQVKHALGAAWMGLGESGKAIECEMEAVKLAPTTDSKQAYQNTLDRYLAGGGG